MPFVSMPFTVFRSIIGACMSAAKPPRRRPGVAGRRNREASMDLEPLEQRMALTVAPTSIWLAAASDTGIRGDGITRLARPVFAGTAPAGSSVVVYADGNRLGFATATPQGAWRFPTPVAMPLVSGAHTITASAFSKAKVLGTATPLSITVDQTSPTASLAYDSLNGIATLTFSEPVSGVRIANLRLTGRTELGVLTNVSITDPRRNLVGSITMTPSENNTKFTFQEQLILAVSGSYTLSFVKTGVVDRAGNPLAAGASVRFTII